MIFCPRPSRARQHRAAIDRAAVDQDGARAALGAVTAQVRAGHVERRVAADAGAAHDPSGLLRTAVSLRLRGAGTGCAAGAGEAAFFLALC